MPDQAAHNSTTDAERALQRLRHLGAKILDDDAADPSARELAEACAVLDTHLTLGGRPPASWTTGRSR